MDLLKITEKVNETINNHNLELFSIKTKREHGLSVLEILLDGSLNSDSIELIHTLILDAINEYLPDDYYLEVSSVGAERPIRDAFEMQKYLGFYINIKSDYYTGDCELLDFDGIKVVISFNQKGKKKTIEIPYEKINHARLAIKF